MSVAELDGQDIMTKSTQFVDHLTRKILVGIEA